MEKATIARPYARAAFEQAVDEGTLKQWSEALDLLARVVVDAGMKKLVGNPHVNAEQLAALVIDVLGGNLSGSIRNFVTLLARGDRLLVGPEIHAQFEVMRARAEGISGIEVISAFELDDAQKGRIRSIMKKRTGKDVDIAATVDKELIGGAVIRAGDSVIDASLRGRLRELRNELSE